MSTGSARRALSGVRLLALEASVAAPHCSRILGDLGADVIKIERPGEGDLIRHWDSAVRGLSSGFVWLNYNKRSAAVDAKKPAGVEALRRLGDRVDVVIENFAPGVAARLGLGPEDLCRRNPRLVYCSLSGYGQTGPWRDAKAYDLLIQGEAGLIAATGYEDRPAKVGIPIADLASSMYAVAGILAALYQRERTGRGQYVDVSMFESLLAWEGYFVQHYWHRGEEPARMGLRHHYITPYGPFLAGDDVYVSFAVATRDDWEVFCRDVIRRPDLLEDPRFGTAESRRQHRAALEGLVEEIFRQHPHGEWRRRLEGARLAHGEVRGIGQALAHPQVAARGVIRDVGSPVGPVHVIASPMRMSESPERLDPIPALGQDTEAVLREIGYSPEEIQRMRAEHVI